MADFNEAIDIILEHEGGYVDHPADPGGATNLGITLKLFKQYAPELGVPATKDSLKALTEQQARHIYKKEFWDKMYGDKIRDQQLATQVFDFYVNAGANAIKVLQSEAGVQGDGAFGPATLAAVNWANPEILFEQFRDGRVEYYKNLVERKPALKVFLKGWLNRAQKFVYKKKKI